MNKFSKRLVVLFGFFLCIFQAGFSEEWMPDGMIVDKRGNVIHMVEMPDDFTGPKKTLTTLAYMAELEKGQTIVNLSKSKAFEVNENFKENAPPPNDGSGFLVTKYLRVGDMTLPTDVLGGAGTVSTGGVFPLSAGPQIGVMIKAGGGVIADLHVKKYADIKKLPTVALVPHNIKALNKYKIGDALSYGVTGGLGLMVGAGAAAGGRFGVGAAVNVGLIAEGTWLCNVRKTGVFTVQARYVKRKLKRLIAYGSLKVVKTIGQAEVNKFWGDGVGTFFEFNLSDKEGLKAYKRFLRGDVTHAQKLALKVKAAKGFTSVFSKKSNLRRGLMKTPVRPLMTYESKISGNEAKGKLDIPVLIGLKAKRGENIVITKTKVADSGLTVKTHLGVWKDERETFGLLKRNNYRLAMFAGNFQRIFKHTPTGEVLVQNRYGGNYKYQYHSEKLMEGELEEEIINLASRVGFKEKLSQLKINQAAVNIRQYLEWKGKEVSLKGKKIALGPKSKKKTLGSTKISADLMIGMTAVKQLIYKAISNGRNWERQAETRAKKWFSNDKNKRWELCTVLLKNWSTKLGRKFCEVKVLKNSRDGMNLAYKSLVRMQKNIADHDYKGFSKNFSKFGKGMTTNQFTFNTILSQATEGDVHFIIQWEGERIPKGELVLINSKKFKYNGLRRVRK